MLYSKTCIGGMVTAPHHLAAQAGAAVLREGGNAVDYPATSSASGGQWHLFRSHHTQKKPAITFSITPAIC
jgi:gamma-glutamyltranspeptidase